MSWRRTGFEVREALSHFRKVNLLEGIATRNELHLFAYTGRYAVGNLGRKLLQNTMKHITEPARIQLADCFIDRNNAPYFDGLLQAFFDQALWFIFVLSEDFHLGLHDL